MSGRRVRAAGATMLGLAALWACGGGTVGGGKGDDDRGSTGARTDDGVDVSQARVERVTKAACKRMLFCQRQDTEDDAAPAAPTVEGSTMGFDNESDCLKEASTAYKLLDEAYDDGCADAYLDFTECSASSSCDENDPACVALDRAIKKRCPDEAAAPQPGR